MPPTPMPPLPPGCYYKQPSAAPKCGGGPFFEWERDVWGEANANSGTSKDDCLARKPGHDSYCEVSTEWRFVGASLAPAPSTMPTTTALPSGSDSSPSFEPHACNWADDLHSASGATFEGATIRTDGGVKLCQDCANRCYVQMNNCMGFVFEPYSNSDSGTCTYYSRVDLVRTADNLDILALTTPAQFNGFAMPSLLHMHNKVDVA